MLARSHAIGLLALTGAVFGLAGCQSTPADISENSTRGSSTNPVSLVQKLKPKRLVIIGDSHSAAPNSWTDSIDCVPVKNWSAAGATVDVNTAFSGLDERIKGLSAGLTPGDVVLIALGSNDVGSWSIADMKRSMSSIRNTLDARNIQLVWSTIPPLSPDYPIPTFLERAQRERTDWNDLIMSTPNAIDLSAPLGDELNPDEDAGDHKNLSASALEAIALTAKQSVCGEG